MSAFVEGSLCLGRKQDKKGRAAPASMTRHCPLAHVDNHSLSTDGGSWPHATHLPG